MGRYQFLEYCIDAQSRTLYRNAQSIYLTPAVFNTLLYLVENANRVVTKEELINAMQPGVVRESTLVKNISAIRNAFAGFNEDSIIQTIAKRGYKLNASVMDLSVGFRSMSRAVNLESQNQHQEISENYRRFLRAEYPVLFALFAFLVASAFVGYSRDDEPRFNYTRLTSNSEKLPILNAAISPDGKQVAYIEANHAYLSQVGSTERRELVLPAKIIATNIHWYPDNESILLSGFNTQTQQSWAWKLSTTTGQIYGSHSISGPVLSTDGSRVAYIHDSGVWLSDGEMRSSRRVTAVGAKTVIDQIVQFSQDGQYLVATCQTPESKLTCVASISIDTGAINRMYQSVNPVAGVVLLHDNVLLVSEAVQNGGRLLAMQVDPQSAVSTHLHVLNKWEQGHLRQLTVSRDERRITGVFDQSQLDVYIGNLYENGNVVNEVRRLTLDDSNDVVAGWQADHQSVLFVSNRHNSFGIYRQALSQLNPKLLSTELYDSHAPLVAADGRWLFYFSTNPDIHAVGQRSLLLRKSLASGGTQVVDMTNDEARSIRCAAVKKFCVIAEHADSQVVYYQFDPEKGRAQILYRTQWNPSGNMHDWDISPDGDRIAYIDGFNSDNTIRIVSLADGVVAQLHTLEHGSSQSVYWDTSGSGLYVSAREHRADGTALQLLHVMLNGSSTLLRYLPGEEAGWMIPSADGKYLAIQGHTANGNVMMLERT